MSNTGVQKNLVLASGSRIRRSILQSAGISFTVAPTDLDEAAIRDEALAQASNTNAADIARTLAVAKAQAISKNHPTALVIGCDQTLFFDGKIFEKPATLAAAHANLMAFRGNTHQLHSAVVLVENGDVLWTTVEQANLTVRNFSEAFIDEYLARIGNEALSSLGGYHLEGLGIQLFERIDGDYFTVLGLPLLALVEELRQRRVLLT